MRSLGRVASSTRSIARYSNIRRFAGPILALSLALCPTAASAALPDGRAYELVSPAEKLGIDIRQPAAQQAFTPIASADGNSVAFAALDALPGSVSNGFINAFLATRGPVWSTQQLNSRIDPEVDVSGALIFTANDDLTRFVQLGPFSSPLTPDAADGVNNLYLRDTDGEFHLITPGAQPFDPGFFALPLAHSDDLGHVVILASALNEGDPPVALYDWSLTTGEPVLVDELPDGSHSPEALLAQPPFVGEGLDRWNPVSADGSRIFFNAEGQLFVRIGGTETKQVSASQATAPDPAGPGPANFRFASADGSRAFFTSPERLTDDSTSDLAGFTEDLYRYDVATDTLTDITVNPGSPGGAEVIAVLGGSDDGERLYFVAQSDLGGDAVAGETNLYLWQDDGTPKGAITYIATGIDSPNWEQNPENPFGGRLTSRVTPDGGSVLFESTGSLTGFDNQGHFEAYLFTVGEGLECASCNPAGTPATKDAFAVGTGDTVSYARTLSDDGNRVFFSTAERLADGDVNDATDTYEYDAAANQISLISAGTGPFPSAFSDASANGDDVQFTTRDRLVGIDIDESFDAYDARVDGGLASQVGPPAPNPCQGQECRGPIAPPPPATTPGSTTASGAQAKPRKRPLKKKRKHRKRRSATRNGQR